MKPHLLTVLLLTATAGFATAQETREVSGPQFEVALTSSKSEDVRRGIHQNKGGFAGVKLRAAHVADVDLNGDGYISFDELLRFDVTKDF